MRAWTDQPLMNVTDAWRAEQPRRHREVLRHPGRGGRRDAQGRPGQLHRPTTPTPQPTITAVKQALAQACSPRRTSTRRIRTILSVRFRLGEFDPGGGPYGGITPDVINSPAHQRLARQAAGEAMVLLKNERQRAAAGPGPDPQGRGLGPLENTLYSDWYGGDLPYQVTPLDGIRERLGTRPA